VEGRQLKGGRQNQDRIKMVRGMSEGRDGYIM